MATEKKVARQRRVKSARMKMRQLGVTRLCVYRTPQHIYAQLIMGMPGGDKVLACASTLDKELRNKKVSCGNIKSATLVGKTIAARGLAAGITKVAFDRSGFKYHGCIKALADAAREGGLQF